MLYLQQRLSNNIRYLELCTVVDPGQDRRSASGGYRPEW